MKKFLEEFKAFALKGNMMDMFSSAAHFPRWSLL